MDLDSAPPMNLPDEVEFIEAISVDISGYSRSRIFPREKIDSLFKNKEEIINVIEVMGSNFEIPSSIKELSDDHFDNNYMVPDRSTLRMAPWNGDSTLAMVFYDPYDRKTRAPSPFNPRLLTKRKIQELEQAGFKLFVGVENEYRLFDKTTRNPVPIDGGMFRGFTQIRQMLPYVRLLRKRLKSIDIDFESCHLECGRGQLELPLKPYSGIEGVDKIWLFKQVAKHVADEMGLIASFMTVPLYNDLASGFHTNHSLWRITNTGLTNAMWDPAANDELSKIGKHWLAGLIKHAKALCAFFSPTVNCYRRTRSATWAPTLASWNYRDRLVSMRVKVSKEQEKPNYIENRLVSSACNIYIVVAAMIAAGLDGIKNQLELPNPGNGPHCEKLPTSLDEALQYLRQDKILTSSLGEKFVDWYINVKQETETVKLKDVNIDDYSEKGIAREIEKYFNL